MNRNPPENFFNFPLNVVQTTLQHSQFRLRVGRPAGSQLQEIGETDFICALTANKEDKMPRTTLKNFIMADPPIAVERELRLYDNTPTTVFVLALNAARELLVIRRGKQPGYGLLGLPGGYQMRGETWQEAGARELLEETGCCAHPSSLEFVSIRTDEYQNNLIIARSKQFVSVECERDNEALAVFFGNDIGGRNDWAHEGLYEAAVAFLLEMKDRR